MESSGSDSKTIFHNTDGKPIVKINHRYFLIDIPLIGYKLGTELNYRISHAQSNNEILALTLDYGYPYLDLVSIDTKIISYMFIIAMSQYVHPKMNICLTF